MSEVLQEYAEKAGAEVIDYVIDYTDDLAESDPVDDISTSSWVVVGNLVITDGTVYTTKKSTVWVSGGGRVGEVSRLTNTVTTVGGRTFIRTLLVKMVTKLARSEVQDLVTYEVPVIP